MTATLKQGSSVFTMAACMLALAGPADAGLNGSPGASAAQPSFVMRGGASASDTARSAASQGQWRGQSYAAWTQSWWRWYTSIPLGVNSNNDSTGVNCGINQDGPVWFLAGPLGGTFTRECSIPQGKAILTPIVTFLNDYPCPDPSFQPSPGQRLEDFLAAGVRPYLDSYTVLQASLDGKPLPARRVTTTLFGFTAAADIRALDSCITGSPQLGVSDGFFITIEPPSPGDHVLQVDSFSPLIGTTSGTFRLKIR